MESLISFIPIRGLVNIISDYIQINEQPFLKEFCNKTFQIEKQLSAYLYYDKYYIHRFDYPYEQYWSENKRDRYYINRLIKIKYNKRFSNWAIQS